MLNNIWKGKNGPLLIAEIGGNHEGSFAYAKKLTKLAIKSKVDVIKFQIYTGDTLVNKIYSPDRNKHFKKCYPIIKEFAKRGKPIILSSGLSKMEELYKTINFLIKQNSKYKSKENLSVLQCTSTYPTLDNETNLDVINSISKNKNVTPGYSDHTIGNLALKIAYSMGAQVLEFHFTDTRKNKTFRDHKVSLTSQETIELINDINRIRKLKGSSIKKPTNNEIKTKHIKTFRRAVFLNKDCPKGYRIREKDLIALRPNIGLDARNYKKIIGKKLKRKIKKLEKLTIN